MLNKVGYQQIRRSRTFKNRNDNYKKRKTI